jgi:signal transduction histidine kinase
MNLGKSWLTFNLFSGVVWGLFYQLILINIPLISQLDVQIIDKLMRSKTTKPPLDNLVLVKIQEKDLRAWGVLKEPNFYSKIAKSLLDSDAKVVVLNLLPNWLKLADQNDNPLKDLVTNYSERIVLVTRVPALSLTKLPELKTFNQLFPFDSETNPLTNPRDIQGFFEYDSTVENPVDMSHPARLSYLQSEFIVADNLNKIETFDSVALLTLKKYQPEQINHNFNQSIYIKFDHEDFPTLEIQDLDHILASNYFQNKIVILGFSDPNNPDSLAMVSPFGEMIPAMELQAHQIANLLTNSYYHILPFYLQLILITFCSIIITYLTVFLELNSSYSYAQKIFLSLVSITLSSILVLNIFFLLQIVVPYFVIVLTWLLTYISTFISLKFSLQKEILQQQEYELMRLHSSEQEAIFTQAKKLINRLASELHDGPLQELKLIMDNLEMLELKNPEYKLNYTLNKLEKLGKNIRKILAEKDYLLLKITPELKKGLHQGIKTKLNELKSLKKLNLKLIINVNYLQEPPLNSNWFAHREDIFLFFCEAINNVIKHAQSPWGNATYLKINLIQKQNQCILEIINDGAKISQDIPQRSRGGYGTKLMETIAFGLPEGNWQRLINNDIVYVILTWNMSKI